MKKDSQFWVSTLFSALLTDLEWKSLSCVWLFVTPWAVACQAPLSMEFSMLKYLSGYLLPSPGDLLNPGIEPRSPALQADSLPSEPPGKPTGFGFQPNTNSAVIQIFLSWSHWMMIYFELSMSVEGIKFSAISKGLSKLFFQVQTEHNL